VISFTMLLAINLAAGLGPAATRADEPLMANRAAQLFIDEHATRPGRDTLAHGTVRAYSSHSLASSRAAVAPLGNGVRRGVRRVGRLTCTSFADVELVPLSASRVHSRRGGALNTLFRPRGGMGHREVRIPRKTS